MDEGHLEVEQKTPSQSRMQSIEKASVTSSRDFEVGEGSFPEKERGDLG